MPDQSYASDLVRCPRCLGKLDTREAGIGCGACERRFRDDGAVLDLRLGRFDYYFNPIPRKAMNELSAELRADNWEESVRCFLALAPNRSWIDNIVAQGRYAWKLLMRLPPGARVLDIGCGLGGLLSSVAPHVEHVVGADLTMERLRFTRQRFNIFAPDRQLSLYASGDGAHLPFADGSFDAVFLSGVLEWVGEGDTSSFSTGSKPSRLFKMLTAHFGSTNPREIQKRFLAEILRVLKPQGQLYCGIENRLNAEYLGRRRDHHSGLWYGSLLPRLPATLYSLLAARRPYRTYTYSRKGYRRLFSEAGFAHTELFGFHDGYSELREISPVDAEVRRWRPTSGFGFEAGLGRHRDFVPAYGVVATKGVGDAPRFLDRLLDEAAAKLGHDIVFSSFHVGADDVSTLTGQVEGRPVVVKLPMSRASREREQRAQAMLVRVNAHCAAAVGLIPEVLASGEHQGQAYAVESAVKGRPIASDAPSDDELGRLLARATDRLQAVVWGGAEHMLDDADVTRVAQGPTSRLGQLLNAPDLAADILRALRTDLVGARMRVGVMHGNLSLRTLHMSDGELAGVTGWHAADLCGLPALDALAIVAAAMDRSCGAAGLRARVRRLVNAEWGSGPAPALASAWLVPLSLGAEAWRGLVLLYAVYTLVGDDESGWPYDPEMVRDEVLPTLDELRMRSAVDA